MLDTVQDHALVITENNVAVFSHQLHDEDFMADITQLIQVFKLKFHYTLQTGLADAGDPGTADVLAE